jgi:hypothetical protein
MALDLSNDGGVFENLFGLAGWDLVKPKMTHIFDIPIVFHRESIP